MVASSGFRATPEPGAYYDILATAALTGAGATRVMVYSDVTAAAIWGARLHHA